MLFHTIPDILSYATEAYGADDAIRWKKSKNEIESRTCLLYTSIDIEVQINAEGSHVKRARYHSSMNP